MSMVTTGEMPTDDGEPKPHPENPARTWYCEGGRHDHCAGVHLGKSCGCTCHGRARTKRHDWLDDRFDDEIDLEKAMGDAPSYALVALATSLDVVDKATAKDRAWFYLGKFKTSAQRPSTNDARWSLTCRRCPKRGRSKLRTKRIVVDVVEPTKIYRVGACSRCRAVFWFELLVG